jgi:beta-mannosidase
MMHTQSLAGDWEFHQAGAHQRGDEEWFRTTVTGGVHTDLLAVGRIPDPFVGDNERRVQWVAGADREYRYQSAVAPELLRQPHN